LGWRVAVSKRRLTIPAMPLFYAIDYLIDAGESKTIVALDGKEYQIGTFGMLHDLIEVIDEAVMLVPRAIDSFYFLYEGPEFGEGVVLQLILKFHFKAPKQ
jgi:hypothetical protein